MYNKKCQTEEAKDDQIFYSFCFDHVNLALKLLSSFKISKEKKDILSLVTFVYCHICT